jgi:hypothetical protein
MSETLLRITRQLEDSKNYIGAELMRMDEEGLSREEMVSLAENWTNSRVASIVNQMRAAACPCTSTPVHLRLLHDTLFDEFMEEFQRAGLI